MRSDFKLQKLFLLLILSLSTLSGCIAAPAPPESAPSPTPEIPVSNEQSQSSEPESSNSFEISSSPLSPQEPTELEKKWDEFLTALSTNITNESEANFKAVQAKAQELKTLAQDRPDLSGFRTYLSDAVISYKNLEESADPIYRNFNNELVKDGLGLPDLAIEGDVATLLSDENKQSTAQQVVEKLNAKYRSLLVSSSANSTASPTSTSSLSPTESSEFSPKSEVEIKWNEFLLALRRNIIDESPENFEKVKQAATELKNFPSIPKEFLNAVINYEAGYAVHSTFNYNLVETGLGIRDLEIGDPTQLLSNPQNRENTATTIVDTLNDKYRSAIISPPSQDNENIFLEFLIVFAALGLTTAAFIEANRRLNIYPPLNNSLFPPPEFPTDSSHSSRELESIKVEVSNHAYRIEDHDQKILSLEQTLRGLDQKIQLLTQSPHEKDTTSPQPQNIYKQMISQTIAVEDANITARRMGASEDPFFVSSKSRRTHLGIYQDQSGQDFLLPTKSKTNYEKLSSYFDLQGSYKDGEVEVIQPAIVIPNGQGWELDQKGIVEFR